MKTSMWSFPLSENYATSLRFDLVPSQAVADAVQAAKDILGNYHSIHVRRNDYLKIYVLLACYTRPSYIANKLSTVIALQSKLYLLSDEIAAGYFDLLKEKYDLYRWYDLPPIKAAVKTRPNDNCFLFFIERLLWADAKLKIATHKPGYAGSDIILYPAYLVRLSQYCNQCKHSIKAGLDWLRQ